MQPFTELHAKAAPLDMANLDTDQIIPKQFLKTVERVGLGKGLFYDLRFDEQGKPRTDFVLNDPSFADIFYNNCFSNGLLPVALPEHEVRALMAEARGGNHVFSVDLAAQTVTAPSGQVFRFEIDPARKEKLLQGLDAIGETLQRTKDIDLYEMRQALAQPWLERA